MRARAPLEDAGATECDAQVVSTEPGSAGRTLEFLSAWTDRA